MPVDYAKLAAQHGGQAAAAPPVDYAALAQQTGGSAAAPAAAAAPPPDPNVDAHGNRTVRNPDGSVKFIQGPGFRGNADESPDRNMLDIGGVGIAPETALMGVQAGRAILKPGLALTGRVAELTAHVGPVVKYEIVKHTLTALGMPDSVATVAAIAVSGYKAGGAKAAAADSAPVVGRVVGKAPTVNQSLETALQEVRTAPTAANVPARLPEYPQAARDTQRLVDARPAPGRSPAPAPARAVAAPVQAAPAPVAAAPVTPPAAALRNLNDAPIAAAPPVTPAQARAQAVLQFNPAKVLAEVKDTFAKLGETPLRAEASNAMELMRRGVPAEEAVARIVKLRAPASAAEDLAARLGGPKDAVVHARVASRNASGRWTE